MRYPKLFAGFAMLAATVLPAAGADAPTPVGRWLTIDGITGNPSGVIEITDIGGELRGRIVKLVPHPGQSKDLLCALCPGDLKNKSVIGMTIMSGVKKDGDAWDGGSILDVDSGDTYSVILRLADGGSKLVVRGYIGISLIGRSQTWIRAPAAN